LTKPPRMIDISGKPVVHREAIAYGRIRLRRTTIERIRKGLIEKGDPLTLAPYAGIMSAKLTPILIPFCHPIPITNVKIECRIEDDEHIGCTALVKADAKTGVEMEALTALTVTLLNIWDIVKKYEKDEAGQYPYTVVEEIKVVEKRKEG